MKASQTVNPVTSDTSATDKRRVLFRTAEHWIYPFHCRVKFPTRHLFRILDLFSTRIFLFIRNVDLV